jgi:hypothetical protein
LPDEDGTLVPNLEGTLLRAPSHSTTAKSENRIR